MPRYALMLFKQSLLIFSALVASLIIFPILGLISHLLDGQFLDLTMSASGIALSTGIAISYALVRSRISSDNREYSTGSRFLHQIMLGPTFVGEATFDIEKALYGSKSRDVSTDGHVFVCGLARAGTTVLMRRLYESDQFRSLTYRDMPFVLAPNLWRKLSGRSKKHMNLQERAHGDGLMVDFNSPEALEEVFWRTHCGPSYIRDSCLLPMSAADETLEEFRTYVSLILKENGDRRYLSKNNNNILRLPSIAEAFPKARILIPFREPEQQAYSLLNQHRRFTQLHSADRFTRQYMTWLVHHEFGTDHRPFRFEEDAPLSGNPDNLKYWLEVWINAYAYISDNLPANADLVCYEALCQDSELVWNKLVERIGVPPGKGATSFTGSFHDIDYSFPVDLLEKAGALYAHLRSKAIGKG